MSGDDRDVIDGMAAATLRWLDEHANSGVITTDRSLVVRTWNKWLATSTDQPPSRVIGKPLFEVVPSFVERGLDAHYRDALLGQSTVLSHTLHKYVIPCVRSSGEMMPQSGRIAPLMADGQVVGTITTLGDVSDRMATEKQLRAQIGAAEEARAEAEAASRANDEFLATLSHEMRLEFAPVNLASVAAAAIETVRPAAELKSIRLVTDLPGKAVDVTGDADRLQQVVWNLLSNAVKFTGNGGMVVVSLRADATGVHLSIADTGQGIERQFLSQVFDRFKQADTSAARRARERARRPPRRDGLGRKSRPGIRCDLLRPPAERDCGYRCGSADIGRHPGSDHA
jgi:signal transduction histidine kinase